MRKRIHRHRTVLVCFLLSVSGCGDDASRSDDVLDASSPDGTPDGGDPDTFDPDDPDGDGLKTADELAGWPIAIDQTALPQGIAFRDVTSDPNDADTDDDGLSDFLERVHRSDPNLTDTDGDGLSDFAEVTRWHTSPTSVDTDGDSRGPNPDGALAPDVSLWDGAELALRDDPLDPDGPRIPGPFARSPLQPDTDGDGVWDFDEGAIVTRSPSVAELPLIEMGIMAGSTIDVGLNVTITEGTTSSREFTASHTTDGSFATELSHTTTQTTTLDVSLEIGGSVTAGVGLDNTGVESEAWVTYRQNMSLSLGMSVTGSESWSKGTTEAYEEMLGETRDKAHTIDGGFIRMALTLTNAGELTVTITDLAIPVLFPDMAYGDKKYGVHQSGLVRKSAAMRPLGTLRPDPAAAEAFTLAPGEAITVLVEDLDVDGSRAEQAMRWPRGLLLAEPQFEVLDADGNNYDFREQAIAELTADFAVDLGPGRVERWRIATNYGFEPDGTSQGISVLDALERVGIDVATQATTAPTGDPFTIYTMGDVATALHDAAGPSLGDPPYVRTTGPGDRWVKRGWYALIQRRSTPGATEFVSDLASARIRASDQVTMAMLEDLDQDGVPGPEERLHGARDSMRDSDNDGLSDFYEIREGWDVTVRGQVARRAWPAPISADLDGDGLADRRELEEGTDPNRRDTDGDGWDDEREVDDANEDPLVFSDHAGPTGSWCPLEPSKTRFHLAVADIGNNLVGVRIEWDDSEPWRVLGYDVPGVESTPYGEWLMQPVASYAREVRSGRPPVRIEAWDDNGNRNVIAEGCP